MPVALGLTDEVYIGIVRVTLPGALDAARPDLFAHLEPLLVPTVTAAWESRGRRFA